MFVWNCCTPSQSRLEVAGSEALGYRQTVDGTLGALFETLRFSRRSYK